MQCFCKCCVMCESMAVLFRLNRMLHDDAVDMAATPSININTNSLEEISRGVRAMARRTTRTAGVLNVPNKVQEDAVVLFMLSGEFTWPHLWVSRWQQHRTANSSREVQALTEPLLQTWVMRLGNKNSITHMMQHPNCQRRRPLDDFLMESLLWEFVQKSTMKNVAIPSDILVDRHLKNWSYRAVDAERANLHRRLQQCPVQRRRWCSRFKKRWTLLNGILNPTASISKTEYATKV